MDLENQLKTVSNAMVYDPEPIQYDRKGIKLTGKLCVVEYGIGTEKYKQWLASLPSSDGSLFYVWTYTAPAKDYDKYFPMAQTMFASWTIKE